MNARALASSWDFFIAHAGPDKAAAERLYDLLATESRVFLDSRCLQLGDDWDAELAAAQRAARVTIVLVSDNTDAAYYEREEIAAAIALARQSREAHRVVPIFLPGESSLNRSVPYGLLLKHGIQLSTAVTMEGAARQLLALLDGLRSTGSATTAPQVSADRTPQQDRPTDARTRDARARIDTYIDQLQVALNHGVVDREATMRQMNALLTLTREAQRDARLEPGEIERLYRRGSQAGRVVALSIAEQSPSHDLFPVALEAVSASLSPWEQYLGLRVLDELVPALSPAERKVVHASILEQQRGGPGQYLIPANAGRWEMANRILRRLGAKGKARSKKT